MWRADRLITDISNASRLDAELSRDAPRNVTLDRLLTDVASLYVDRPPVTLDIQPGQNLEVIGREGPLGQVFRNLIDNARSFSPEDGSVRIVLARDSQDPDLPVVVMVEDDGPGIPEENLETVFRRFYTSRPKGAAFGSNSGLGLSIARQIVEAHGGVIVAENRREPAGEIAGARFVIRLPAAR